MRISDWSSDVCSSDLVLIDWPQSIARMERHECLTGELVNRQAISIDAENRIGGHDVANAARCNDVHRNGRGDVGQAREAKTAQTLRNNPPRGNERTGDWLHEHGLREDRKRSSEGNGRSLRVGFEGRRNK